ncbi:MAG: alternative ribosome rescue aminoacyl-tRNA hydrolase ArfB [Anaerolineales bacterium]
MADIDPILRRCDAQAIFEYVRASGPGGQNVNKVATAAQLRFNVRASTDLPMDVKLRLERLAGKRMTTDGVLLIEARRYRTQEQNRLDAIERFNTLLRKAFEKPKRRISTRATAASREKRLEFKRKRGEVKRTRQSRSYD